MLNLKRDIFNKPNSNLRGSVINDGVKVERAVNLIITSAFGVTGKKTKSFENSSSLSFIQKVNLLSDLGIIDNKEYTLKFTRFAEIKNEFAHKFNVNSFQEIRIELIKFLNKYYRLKGEDEELNILYYRFYVDIQDYCQIIYKNLILNGDIKVATEWANEFVSLLLTKIDKSLDLDFKEKYNILYKEANEELSNLNLPYDLNGKILI